MRCCYAQFKHENKKRARYRSAPQAGPAYRNASQYRKTSRNNAKVKKMTNYIALLRKEEGSDFSVEFPDFPGCVTAGATLDEAKDMAGEALALHIEGMLEDGVGLPTPSLLEAIMADPHNSGTVAFLVDTPAAKEKAVRVNVTILESVLRRVDAHAKARHLTRSAFLAEAAMKAIGDASRT